MPLFHFNIASNYGYGLPLPNSTVLYLLSQTSTLKNSKSHNPRAQSGFVSVSWLLYLMIVLLGANSPGVLLVLCVLKASFVDSSSTVFCFFFFCKDISSNVKVSGLLYQYGFFPTTLPFYVCPCRLQQQYATQSASSQAK